METDNLNGQPTQIAVVLSTTPFSDFGHSFASLQFSHKKVHYPPFGGRASLPQPFTTTLRLPLAAIVCELLLVGTLKMSQSNDLSEICKREVYYFRGEEQWPFTVFFFAKHQGGGAKNFILQEKNAKGQARPFTT